MAQVKVFALKQNLDGNKDRLSEIIHSALVQELGLPPGKKFQRFFPLAQEDFFYPSDRTSNYAIIEISLFTGRSEEKIKALIKRIMAEAEVRLGFHPNDIEITVSATPQYCWGIRGKTGDELALGYQVNV